MEYPVLTGLLQYGVMVLTKHYLKYTGRPRSSSTS